MRSRIVLALAVTLVAQESRFGVQSRLVLVPVTVVDAKGRTVDGLEAQDFAVIDNGRPQTISVDTIGTGVAPVALVIAVQTSGISKPVLEKVQKIGAMIQPLVTGDRGCAAVVSFSERIDWIQDCTNDPDALIGAFQQLHHGQPKGARMLDAVYDAVKRLEKYQNSRRVLLLISESRDRGSETRLDQAAIAAQTAGVSIYAATYSALKSAWTTKSSATAEPRTPKRPDTPSEQTGTMSGGQPKCNPYGCPEPWVPPLDQRVDVLGGITELTRLGQANSTAVLATGTGGATFPFTRFKGLEEAIQKLGAELHTQYVLSFTPDDLAPGFHRLQVKVDSGDFRVRARPGYWSTQTPLTPAPESGKVDR
jgi:VWFA-related protein